MEPKENYRLPWTLKDNILVWYDVTKECGMDCDECYSVHKPGSHKPLAAVKAEILKLKEKINFDVLALGGGEPLAHPEILDIVKFGKSEGLKMFLSTNGSLLTDELLAGMKKAGLEGINLHVDSLQRGRPEYYRKGEEALNPLRSEYLERITRHGLRVFYNISLSSHNAASAGKILKYVAENSPDAEYLVFAVLKSPDGNGESSPAEPGIPEVLSAIRGSIKEFEYSAQLDYIDKKTGERTVKWCLSVAFVAGGRILGFAGPGFIGVFQRLFRFFTGRYPGAPPRAWSRLGLPYLLVLFPFSPRYRRMLFSWLKLFRKSPSGLLKIRLLNVFIIKPESVAMDKTPAFFGG